MVSTLLVTVLELLSLLVLHQLGYSFNAIPSGPIGLAFSLVYQYFRLVPSTYHFRVFGVALSNKAFVYALASQVNKLLPNLQRNKPLRLFVFHSARPQSAMVHYVRSRARVFRWLPIPSRHC